MFVRAWGCRGSLATPEKEKLKYGGNTTCVEVVLNDGTLIVFDAGTGIRKLGQSILKRKEVKEIYLFLTHAHWDHLSGFPFFVPAYIPANTIHVRGGPRAKRFLHDFLSKQMEPPYFPVTMNEMKAKIDFKEGKPEKMKIGSAEILPIPLNHPNGGYGFRINDKKGSFVFLTDNEPGFNHPGGLKQTDYIQFSKGADLLFHDSQYTSEEYAGKKGWGHSTFRESLLLGMSARVRHIGFFHHDPERSDGALDTIVNRMKMQIEEDGRKLSCFGVKENTVITIRK